MGAGFVGAEPVAVAVDGDGDAAVEEPVEEGCCDGGVGEDVAPVSLYGGCAIGVRMK